MTEPLIIGAMVRALGAYPSGWRQPGAHRDPAADADILRHIAREGEDAGLDYLFFGDWLATGPDLEFRDPYLLARGEVWLRVQRLFEARQHARTV